MKDKIKNGIIISFVIVIITGGIFGGKAVKKYNSEIASLKYEKTALALQKSVLETQIKMKQDTIKKKDAEIVRLQAIFKAKDKKIAELTADIDSALIWLNFITADSSYQFLQEVAYNYPGALKYLFNELQIKYIHADYLKARSSEKVIPILTSQVNNCKDQFVIRDGIEKELKAVNELQKQTLTNCEKINQDNDKIIKDTEKQRDKEKHRKNFWRFTSAVAAGVAVIVSVFGL